MKRNITFYAGRDVSLDETHICIVNAHNTCLSELRIPTDPSALRTAPGQLKCVGLEARLADLRTSTNPDKAFSGLGAEAEVG
jgi:hypothetical protein